MNEIPEVESAARTLWTSNKLITYKEANRSFIENEIWYADSTLFDIFSIPLITGDPTDLLTRNKTAVITEKMAGKYFQEEDPIGKILNYNGSWDVEITAVVKDWPQNSNWHFDMLISMISIQRAYDESWLSDNLHTFMLLRSGAEIDDVMPKINDLVHGKFAENFKQVLGISFADWEAQGNKYDYYATALGDMYLRNTAQDSIGKVGDIRYVYLFAVIGFFILFVACINFMNLNTARAGVRAKEIGMRKVLGSTRKQLIRQFLLESILISFFAMIIALIAIELLMPSFNQLTGKNLILNFSGITTIPILFLLTLAVGLMAGGYSAISLSSFNIITILKGSLFKGRSKSWFRNALVLFQFSISILVIICTIIAMKQMEYIQTKKLGFDKEQLLVIDRVSTLDDQLPLFKQELLKYPGIINCSATFHIPGTGTDGSVYQKEDSPPEEMFHFRKISGDYDYLKTMGITLLSGRYFKEDINDEFNIVINKTGADYLGFKDAVGQKILVPDTGQEYHIIGVLEDFHSSSLHYKIESVMMFHPGFYWDHYMAVRIQPENVTATMSYIKDVWKEFSGGQPFDYFFMDTFYDSLHRSEQRTGKFFAVFASLAIFIACLGLFGLAAFTTEQKTKEIGVRKVLGASVTSIISILLKQFTRWVVIANFIAWPIGYFIMKSWLQNFAYHIDLNIGYFILSGMITLLIAALTVSYLTINAANRNPVKALKYEL